MKFQQITILDKITLTDGFLTELEQYSAKPVRAFESDPKDQTEIIKRVAEADCILLSWRTPLDKDLFQVCPNLKFISLCATNSDQLDLQECSKRNIVVSNVRDYGDEGVVEWLIHELLDLARGYGQYQWQDSPAELNGKTIGIIGLGAVGKLLAQAALGLKMKVLYNSQTKNSTWESKGLIFAEKKDLLQKSDIISLQTPKNFKILSRDNFALMKEKILTNNTLGRAFESDDFREWIRQPGNYAIMDAASDFGDEFKSLDKVIYSDFVSGLTNEAATRLSQKILENIKSYLAGKPTNKVSG